MTAAVGCAIEYLLVCTCETPPFFYAGIQGLIYHPIYRITVRYHFVYFEQGAKVGGSFADDKHSIELLDWRMGVGTNEYILLNLFCFPRQWNPGMMRETVNTRSCLEGMKLGIGRTYVRIRHLTRQMQNKTRTASENGGFSRKNPNCSWGGF